jgi:hypothetical protein
MKQVWNRESWRRLQLSDTFCALMERAESSPFLGDLTVRDLCCLARTPWSPVGIYIFSDDDKVLYTGKTHGRSFQERMLSHIDHRDPIEGSPHLAQLVQSILKNKKAKTADEAVEQVLNMKITWLPVVRESMEIQEYKKKIALIERRLLWKNCLDPFYNSPRVKRNDSFTIAGDRHYLRPDMLIGE